MGPIPGSHSLTTTIWLRCWPDQLRASHLLAALGRQLGDDQFSVVVVDKETLAVSYQEATRPPCLLASDLQRLPDAFPGAKVQTSELAIAANSIDRILQNSRGYDGRMQTVGIDFGLALSFPNNFGRRPVVVEFQKQGAIVKRGNEQVTMALNRRYLNCTLELPKTACPCPGPMRRQLSAVMITCR